MKKNRKEYKQENIDLSSVVAAPILSGPSNKHIWTGIIKSEKITSHIIQNDAFREEFVKLVKDLEKSVMLYRTRYGSVNNLFNVRNKLETDRDSEILENYIKSVAAKLKQYLVNAEENGIDMELFWVELCREYEEILEENKDEFNCISKEGKKNLEAFRISFTEKQPCIRELYVEEENKYICQQFFTKSQEDKYQKGTSQNIKQLVQIVENVADKKNLTKDEGIEVLKEIVTGVTAIDLLSIFKNPKYGEMQFITFLKNYLLKKGLTSEEIEKMDAKEIADLTFGTYNSDTLDFHASLVAETVINSIDYIDMEKFALISMIRPLKSMELMSSQIEESDNDNIEIINELSKNMTNNTDEKLENYIKESVALEFVIEKSKRMEYIIKKILETNIISKKTKFNLIVDNKQEEISLKKLDELMKKFCDGIYLTEVIELNLKYKAYSSKDEMSKWSDELISKMNFSNQDKYILSLVNFENLKRLYKLGMLNAQDIKNILKDAIYEVEENLNEDIDEKSNKTSLIENAKKLHVNLFNENLIDENDLKEFLEEGYLNLEMLEGLEENKSEEEIKQLHKRLGNVFNQEMLLNKYKEYVEKYLEFTKQQVTSPEENEKIEELRAIVNDLRLEKDELRYIFNKYHSERNVHILGDELLEKYYVEMDVTEENMLKESIKILYEDGMIDLENIIHLDKSYVIPMLDSLSLEDASKIRKSMSFKELEEMLDDIFSREDFSDERRFIVVMNLLGEDTEEDKKARDFYLSMLEFDNSSERKAKIKGRRNLTGEGTKESNKYIYPDFVKWKFYKGLDKDVRVTRYANGFVEFASNKLGVRIIEKYYDGNKPAYGTATYILPEQEFRKNQANLITITSAGNILESATLREITPKRDRIAHRTQSTDRTWMDEIVKYFDIDYERENDTRYTKEELSALQSIVKRYKTEYEMIM